MTEMSAEEALERYGPTDPGKADLLRIDDPAYHLDNVAIVTGGASGIGRATALALAANGLTVLATDRAETDLGTLQLDAKELALPGVIKTVVGDLRDDETLEEIVDTAAALGDIRYLLNIAGFQHIAPIESFPIEQYDAMQAVMQRAPFILTSKCLPQFRANGDGRGVVANMCSVHGHIVTEDKVAYSMTKFALRGLTQAIAAEGQGTIRSFTISTAYVKTALVAEQLPATAKRRNMRVEEVVDEIMLEHTQATEMLEPYEVANLFVFGCSHHCRHLNGGDMLHDGGMTRTY